MSSIIPVVPLPGTISEKSELIGTLVSEREILSGEISSDIPASKKYPGPYTVVPRKVEQTLWTADKLLTKDVTINAINYSEVDNPTGGKTVNIGYE